MSIFDKAIQVSINNLRAAGCKFRIETASGEVHTNIEAPKRKPRTVTVPIGTYSAIYIPAVKDMQVGELRSVTVPNGINVESFRSSMAAWASVNWGKGVMQSQIDGNVVHFMRQS